MPNGVYGRAVPRLALAVAEYVRRFNEWPTRAHGVGVMAIVQAPDDPDDHEHQSEFRPELAKRVLSRLDCDGDGGWIDVSGPAGQCSYGLVDRDDPLVTEAYRWLYDEDPWWLQVP